MTVEVAIMTRTDGLGEDIEELLLNVKLGSHFEKIVWQFIKTLNVAFPYSLAFPLLEEWKPAST